VEVKKLQQSIIDYQNFVRKDRDFTHGYIWESLQHFQNNWDIDAPDFAAMYDQSFQNEKSRRLWKRDAWFPKEMMLKLAQLDPEFVRRMFKDLIDEDKEIEGRISRFKFGCDTLLQDYKSKQAVSIENNHFHENNEMIFLYLAFLIPDIYTLFHYPAFQKVNELLATPIMPGPYDLTRFVKITNVFNTFLQRDEALMEVHEKRLDVELRGLTKSRILVFDFYENFANGFRV